MRAPINLLRCNEYSPKASSLCTPYVFFSRPCTSFVALFCIISRCAMSFFYTRIPYLHTIFKVKCVRYLRASVRFMLTQSCHRNVTLPESEYAPAASQKRRCISSAAATTGRKIHSTTEMLHLLIPCLGAAWLIDARPVMSVMYNAKVDSLESSLSPRLYRNIMPTTLSVRRATF